MHKSRYWDWSLSRLVQTPLKCSSLVILVFASNIARENMTDSPAFSNTTGFGRNGDPSTAESVGKCHCVTNGPFAHLALPFCNSDDYIHYLSHGFSDGKVSGRLAGDQVRPAAIEKILR